MPATSARAGDGAEASEDVPMRGVHRAPQPTAAANLDGLGGAELEVDALRRVVPANDRIELTQRPARAVDAALHELRAGRDEDHGLPRSRDGSRRPRAR